MDEKTSKLLINPLIILSYLSDSIENYYSSSIQVKNNTLKSEMLNGVPTITQFKINYRYEDSGNSEYSYERVWYFSNGGIQNGGDRIEIREMKNDEIGKLFINKNVPLQKVGAGGWFVTFEYDWYASKKSVFVAEGPVPLSVNCRMKYSDEWYQVFFIYFDVQSIRTIYTKGLITIDNY